MQILALAFLFFVLQRNSATQVLYVFPRQPTAVACPHQPCNMLSYYVHHTHILSSNSTLHFLPGIHVLKESTVLVVQKTNNFTISGEKHDESIVLCAENAGFIFTDILGLTVNNLSFLYCGYGLPTTSVFSTSRAVLWFASITNLQISQINVFNGTGCGISALQPWGDVSISDSVIAFNSGNIDYIGGNI